MASIFLSYAREDVGVARMLAGALERIGHSVWWDRHIKGGSQFAAEIESALAKAEAVIVLWSGASVGSPWVRDEASAARDSGRLVPASIDGAQPPMGFRQYQSVDLTGWKGRRTSSRFAALVEAVDSVLGGGGARVAGEGTAAAPARTRAVRRLPLLAVLAVLVIGLVATAAYIYRTRQPTSGPIAMAVLPFDAIPADQQNSPFAEGLAEEISGELARNPRLQMIGRTSAGMFRDSNADAKTIGRKLRVAYLVDGSVRRAGNRVRVGVELVRASDGARVWRQSYDGTLDDIFAIQDRIGQSVEGQLRASFVGKEGVTAKSLATRGDVYGYYLTARSLLREPGKFSGSRTESIATAEELLRKAIAVDPNYAPAWAQLSGAVLVQREFLGPGGTSGDAAKLRQQAYDCADRALALAPQLAEAHYAKARSLVGPEGRTAANLRGLQTAARLDPNNADVWFSLGNYYSWAGDYPAELDARRKAIALEPLWLFAFWPAIDSAWGLGFEEEALRYARRVERDGDPQPFQAHMIRSVMAFHNGDWSFSLAEALAARRSADSGRKPLANIAIAVVLRATGDLERARPFWPEQMDDLIWKLWHGDPPPPREVAALSRDPGFWMNEAVVTPLLKALVSRGRSAQVVDLYRRRFGAPDKLQRYPMGHAESLADSATIAMALRDVGMGDEANRMLSPARQSVDDHLRRGRVPRSYYYRAALVAAAQGDDRTALRWLERADANKWWYAQEFALPDIAEEPAFRALKANPRFQAVAARQRAWQARERREMAPLLAQLGTP